MAMLSRPPRRSSVSEGNLVAMLSLKLLLLAFFILLSTMSSYEAQRSRAVIDSVSTAFRGPAGAHRSISETPAALEALPGADSFVARLRSLFSQAVPLVQMEDSPDGGVLRLEMPASALFTAGSDSVAPWRAALLRRLARILGDGPRSGHELRFVHTVPDGASAARPGAGSPVGLAVRRGGSVARQLTRYGLAAHRLSVGLWPASGGGARVAFEVVLHDGRGASKRFRAGGRS